MKKRRLKGWVKVAITFIICVVVSYFLALRIIECYFM